MVCLFVKYKQCRVLLKQDGIKKDQTMQTRLSRSSHIGQNKQGFILDQTTKCDTLDVSVYTDTALFQMT